MRILGPTIASTYLQGIFKHLNIDKIIIPLSKHPVDVLCYKH